MNKVLIIGVVNRGFGDMIMAAAKKAGATGGTIVPARGTGKAEAIKFLGVTIDPEKDMLMIMVDNSLKVTIMEAIYERASMHNKGNGIVFSLPVDSVMGADYPNLPM
ncbi:MAG: P-II family nitrogen regulator [Clostridia bacterium]